MFLKWLRDNIAIAEPKRREFWCAFCKRKIMSDNPEFIAGRKENEGFHRCPWHLKQVTQLVKRKYKDCMDTYIGLNKN
jgi:hypothetical protein